MDPLIPSFGPKKTSLPHLPGGGSLTGTNHEHLDKWIWNMRTAPERQREHMSIRYDLTYPPCSSTKTESDQLITICNNLSPKNAWILLDFVFGIHPNSLIPEAPPGCETIPESKWDQQFCEHIDPEDESLFPDIDELELAAYGITVALNRARSRRYHSCRDKVLHDRSLLYNQMAIARMRFAGWMVIRKWIELEQHEEALISPLHSMAAKKIANVLMTQFERPKEVSRGEFTKMIDRALKNLSYCGFSTDLISQNLFHQLVINDAMEIFTDVVQEPRRWKLPVWHLYSVKSQPKSWFENVVSELMPSPSYLESLSDLKKTSFLGNCSIKKYTTKKRKLEH